MVILEGPYVSDHLLDYLEQQQVPVLNNAFARGQNKKGKLHLIETDELVESYKIQQKLYLQSENGLDWVYHHLKDDTLMRKLEVIKDKGLFRQFLKDIYPDFYFQYLDYEDLKKLDASILPYPVVLKPAVGFFSLGVYVIANKEEWEKALHTLEATLIKIKSQFPQSVVSLDKFVIEAYIEGTEYAVDAYYNREGKPVILNIFTHRFASSHDVSDRIYYTSKEMIETYKVPFEAFLTRMNEKLGLFQFPMHIEFRLQGDKIIPIEVNPMRFAGLSCTDMAYYAYGINTVDYFLNDKVPDFNEILKGKENQLYSMIVLDKKTPELSCKDFQYDKLYEDFEEVLMLRKVDTPVLDIFGFLFVKTQKGHEEELDRILTSDLMTYLRD